MSRPSLAPVSFALLWAFLPSLVLVAGPTFADSPDILDARVQCRRNPQKPTLESLCRFQVKIRHKEDGWKHYVRHFQLVDEDGNVVLSRFLRQPHQGEGEEFIRGMQRVIVPRSVERGELRAGDLEHERGKTFALEIPHPPLPPETDGDAGADADGEADEGGDS